MLTITNYTTRIADKEINKAINLTIKPGEIHLITGSNGAGKSTLVKGLFKYPGIEVSGKVELDGKDISNYKTEEIAKAGLFISHQTPVEIPGIKYLDFLRLSYNSTREEAERIDLWTFVDIFNDAVKRVGLPKEFIDRELNAGFSGGEKKKSEILQMLILEPKYAFLDEIDSGLDIKSTKNIYDIINETAKIKKTGFIIITHNPKISDYIKPTMIHVLKDGRFSN
jgi:Fe-S cluster assembly ATP-binding protein